MTPKIDREFQGLIPPLTIAERSALETSLKAEGCRDALITWRGLLLDGHNRLEICSAEDIAFKTIEIDLPDREAAADWIDANQLGRRNLTPDQASLLRGRRYNRAKKKHGNEGGKNDRRKGLSAQSDHLTSERTADQLAKQHGVSAATIKRDGKRAEFIEQLGFTAPDEAAAVRDGKKRINEVRRTARLAEVKEAAKLPDRKYRVIYADPPWKYGDQLTESYGSTKFHYPSMTITELCAMPIQDICEDDAVLFLWVTSPLLFECAPIIEAWGFEYKSSFVWHKLKHNMGHYNSVRHEFLLICTRGSCTPDSRKLFESVQSIERGKHSEKPEKFREMIAEMYQHGKRIELFARKQVDGWDAYGNQVA